MTWQRVCRCVVVQVAHFTWTAQRQQSCMDRWNDEVATHSRTQTASMKVACNWLTHVHQVTGWVLARVLGLRSVLDHRVRQRSSYHLTWVMKNWTLFHLRITFANTVRFFFFHYCRQKLSAHKHWIPHFTYSLLLRYLGKCNRIHFFTKTIE